MAIGDTSTPQSQARLADLGQRLASLEAPHLGPLITALEAPPRVRDAPSHRGDPPALSRDEPGALAGRQLRGPRCWSPKQALK